MAYRTLTIMHRLYILTIECKSLQHTHVDIIYPCKLLLSVMTLSAAHIVAIVPHRIKNVITGMDPVESILPDYSHCGYSQGGITWPDQYINCSSHWP